MHTVLLILTSSNFLLLNYTLVIANKNYAENPPLQLFINKFLTASQPGKVIQTRFFNSFQNSLWSAMFTSCDHFAETPPLSDIFRSFIDDLRILRFCKKSFRIVQRFNDYFHISHYLNSTQFSHLFLQKILQTDFAFSQILSKEGHSDLPNIGSQ